MQNQVAKKLLDYAPLMPTDNYTFKVDPKDGGYDAIKYCWSENGYEYEMRWHTATPNAPEGTPPNWRVDRHKPGFAGGRDPVTGKKLQGYPGIDEVLIWPSNGTPYYILEKDWKIARYAYGKGTATQAQLEILKYGHYISE